MEAHLTELEKETTLTEFGPVLEWEELSIDDKRFPNNVVTKNDWAYLQGMEKLQALALTSCALEKIEVPDHIFEEVEVLDLSKNRIVELDFLSKLPNLVSLTLHGVAELALGALEKALKDHQGLRVLEFDEDATFGLESAKTLREKCFGWVPGLMAVNNMKLDGTILENDEELQEEEADLEANIEENGEWEEEEEDSDEEDDEEEDEENGQGDLAEGEAAGEPAVKKQKTAE